MKRRNWLKPDGMIAKSMLSRLVFAGLVSCGIAVVAAADGLPGAGRSSRRGSRPFACDWGARSFSAPRSFSRSPWTRIRTPALTSFLTSAVNADRSFLSRPSRRARSISFPGV